MASNSAESLVAGGWVRSGRGKKQTSAMLSGALGGSLYVHVRPLKALLNAACLVLPAVASRPGRSPRTYMVPLYEAPRHGVGPIRTHARMGGGDLPRQGELLPTRVSQAGYRLELAKRGSASCSAHPWSIGWGLLASAPAGCVGPPPATNPDGATGRSFELYMNQLKKPTAFSHVPQLLFDAPTTLTAGRKCPYPPNCTVAAMLLCLL